MAFRADCGFKVSGFRFQAESMGLGAGGMGSTNSEFGTYRKAEGIAHSVKKSIGYDNFNAMRFVVCLNRNQRPVTRIEYR